MDRGNDVPKASMARACMLIIIVPRTMVIYHLLSKPTERSYGIIEG
jgi:hypothetical protein